MSNSVLKYVILFCWVLTFHNTIAQDSLVFSNGSIELGEIKSLSKSTLTIKTIHSKENFKIKRDHLSRVYTQNSFLIITEELNGESKRYYGTLSSVNDSIVAITTRLNLINKYPLKRIISIEPLGDTFREKFNTHVALGYNIAKANKLSTFNGQADMDYRTLKWYFYSDYSLLRSSQTGTDLIRREEGNIEINYFLTGDWFIVLNFNVLSNRELNLEVRNKMQVGIAKYLIQTEILTLATAAGINQNSERFEGETINQNSLESMFGVLFGLYTSERYDITLKMNGYPGIRKTNRFRMDASLESKIKITSDFYFSLGSSFNFDNKPTQGDIKSDYVIKTGIGWKFR